MKCTIESIRNIELKDKRFGSRIIAFVPIAEDFIFEPIRKWISKYEGVQTVLYAEGIKITSWAESKCSDADEYNPLTGAHLAESKAKAKMYRFLRNFAKKMEKGYGRVSNYMLDAYTKYDYCVEHEEEHTKYLASGK